MVDSKKLRKLPGSGVIDKRSSGAIYPHNKGPHGSPARAAEERRSEVKQAAKLTKLIKGLQNATPVQKKTLMKGLAKAGKKSTTRKKGSAQQR